MGSRRLKLVMGRMGEAVFGLLPILAGRWGDKRGLSQFRSLGQLPR